MSPILSSCFFQFIRPPRSPCVPPRSHFISKPQVSLLHTQHTVSCSLLPGALHTGRASGSPVVRLSCSSNPFQQAPVCPANTPITYVCLKSPQQGWWRFCRSPTLGRRAGKAIGQVVAAVAIKMVVAHGRQVRLNCIVFYKTTWPQNKSY